MRRFFLRANSGRFVRVIAASSGSDRQTNRSSRNLLYHSSPVDSPPFIFSTMSAYMTTLESKMNSSELSSLNGLPNSLNESRTD